MVGAIMMEILYVLSVIMIRVSGVAIRNNNRNPRRYGGDFYIIYTHALKGFTLNSPFFRTR